MRKAVRYLKILLAVVLLCPVFFVAQNKAGAEANTNLALGATATLLSNSGDPLEPSFNGTIYFVAANAIDGDTSTTAQAGGYYDWTLQVELDSVKSNINHVRLVFPLGGYATEYNILTSVDGASWSTAIEVTSSNGTYASVTPGATIASDQTASAIIQDLSFSNISAKYIRVVGLKPNGPDQPGVQMSIAELEIYAATSVPLTITTTNSTQYLTNPATAIYPAFVDQLPYQAWTMSGSTNYFPLQAIGGSGGYEWTLISGTMPTGLSLAVDGKISGTPTTEGTFSFRVRVKDSSGATVEKDLVMAAEPYRAKWMTDAKFGFMVQWGAFSEPAVTSKTEIAQFESRIVNYDAGAWCQNVVDHGGEVLNFTVRAGDGVRLWPSTTPTVNGLNTTRDIVGELIDACHARGVKFVAYFAPDITWIPTLSDASSIDNTWGTMNVGLVSELLDKGIDGIWVDVSGSAELWPTIDPNWFPWDKIIPLIRTKNPYVTIANNPGVKQGGRVLKYPNADVAIYEGEQSTSEATLVQASRNLSTKKIAVEVDNMLDSEWAWNPARGTPKAPKSAEAIIRSIRKNWDNGATFMLNFPVHTDGTFIPSAYKDILDEVGDWVKNNREWTETPVASLDDRLIYSSSQTITLSSESGASIYYTTDGSTPTLNSSLYTAPLTLEQSTRIKALAVKSSKGSSLIMDKSYIILTGADSSTSFATGNLSPDSSAYDAAGVYSGVKITVSSRPITLHQIGRYAMPGNTGVHRLVVKRQSDGEIVLDTEIDMSEGTVATDGFKYKHIAPLTLEAGATYYVLSQEGPQDAKWGGNLSSVTTSSHVSIIGPVWSDASGSYWSTIASDLQGTGQLMNFKYTLDTDLSVSPNLAFGARAYMQDSEGNPLLPSDNNAFAEYAVDGNPATPAIAAWVWDWTLHVDLGKVQKGIDKVVVNFFKTPSGVKLYATDYEILLSQDGVNWQTVAHAENNAAMRSGATFSPTAARYVRVRALKPNGPDQPGIEMAISELEVYSHNLAFGTEVKLLDPAGSPIAAASVSTGAVNAVDGDPTTAAEAVGNGKWVLQSDLGTVKKTINNIVVHFENSKSPTDFDIMLSDNGANWSTVKSVHHFTGTSYSAVFMPIDARYVRIESTSSIAPMSVTELEVYNDNVALGTSANMQNSSGDILASSGDDPTKHVASWAVDGDLSTFAIAGGAYDWTLHDDLGRVVNRIHGVSVTFPSNLYATEFQILLSVDGQTWQMVDSVTGAHGGGTYTSQFDPTDARYVRVKAIKPNDANQEGIEMAISELGVYAMTSDDAKIEFNDGEYVSQYDQAVIRIRNMEDTAATITARVFSDSVTAGMDLVLTRQADGSYKATLGFSETGSSTGVLKVKDGDHVWIEYADISNRIGELEVFQSGTAVWRKLDAFSVAVSYKVGQTNNPVSLQPNQLLEASVTVTNRMIDNKPVIVITALYNPSGTMVNVSYLSKTIGSHQTETIYTGFRLPQSVSGYKVKTFVWDGSDLDGTLGIPYSTITSFPQ